MTTGQLLAQHFVGRADYIAVADENGGFAPHACPDGIHAAWLDDQHLAGQQAYGFYVLNPDSRCRTSCIDIDDKPDKPNPAWREQVEAIYYELTCANVAPVVELSQSGRGAHVWLLFNEWIDAALIRAWWKSWEDRLRLRFREIFPKQDRLTGKGLGNLVRYPLWGQSRFVDIENAWSVVDPAAVLAGPQRLNAADLRLLAFQLGFGELRREADAATADDGLPLRVRRLVDKPWTLLGRRWLGDTRDMLDSSPSAAAMSIAVELVRGFIPTVEIETALRYWLRKNGREDKADRPDWIGRTVSKAYDFMLARDESKSVDTGTFKGCVDTFLDGLERGEIMHVASGVNHLDLAIEGVAAGEVCVIAARPSHGKSAFAFQWLDNAAAAGQTCLCISEEMSGREVGRRRLQSISELEMEKWGERAVPKLRIENETHHAQRQPIYFVENCNTIRRVEEVVDGMCKVHGVTFVAVDYLQLLGGAPGDDRYQVVTECSRRIKQLARRNNCCILLLSQMNRVVESRSDRTPKNSDLRESGQIEQDADLIMFLEWPHRSDPKKEKDVHRFLIHVTKRRNGAINQLPGLPTGMVVCRFDPYRQRIYSE